MNCSNCEHRLSMHHRATNGAYRCKSFGCGCEVATVELKTTVWTDVMRAELANLFHLARTALANDPKARSSRYHWRIWASKEYEKAHPEVCSTAAYKELDRWEAWRWAK